MEDLLGVTLFKDHFLKYCGAERPQMIILNSHSSHETLGLIELAREHNIALFALPPHTTQYPNPLDKTVFGPFQREYNKTCTYFMSESPNNMVTKWECPRLLKCAYIKTVNPENIINGFAVCGIYSFNPARIPDSAFAPSVPFDRPLLEKHAPEPQLQNDKPPGVTPADKLHTTDQLNDQTESNTYKCANSANSHQEPEVTVSEVEIPEGELIATADQNGNMVLATHLVQKATSTVTSPTESVRSNTFQDVSLFQGPQPASPPSQVAAQDQSSPILKTYSHHNNHLIQFYGAVFNVQNFNVYNSNQ